MFVAVGHTVVKLVEGSGLGVPMMQESSREYRRGVSTGEATCTTDGDAARRWW